jgi:hypothetical protein
MSLMRVIILLHPIESTRIIIQPTIPGASRPTAAPSAVAVALLNDASSAPRYRRLRTADHSRRQSTEPTALQQAAAVETGNDVSDVPRAARGHRIAARPPNAPAVFDEAVSAASVTEPESAAMNPNAGRSPVVPTEEKTSVNELTGFPMLVR